MVVRTGDWCVSRIFADDPAKKEDVMSKKKEGEDRNLTPEQQNHRNNGTCNKTGRGVNFGKKFKLQDPKFQGTIPRNLPGSV